MNTQFLKQHIASSSLLLLLLFLSINPLFCNAYISTTQVNKKYTGHVLKTFFNADWLSCLEECSRIEQCVSYNFELHSVKPYCVLYDSGIEVSCDGKTSLIHSEKSFYQQLKLFGERRAGYRNPPRVEIKIQRRLKQTIFKCHVITQQATRVTWYKNGKFVLSRTIKYSKDVTFSCNTAIAVAGFYGNYTCVAITKYGRASSYVILSQRPEYPDAQAVFPLNGISGLKDISGNNNPSGVVQMEMPLAPGPYGLVNGSYKFVNQPASYIKFPNNGKLDTRTSTTILFWIFIKGIDVMSSIVSYALLNESAPNWGVSLMIETKVPLLVLQSRGSDQNWKVVQNTTAKLSANNWHYLAASYNYTSGMGSLWVNGTMVAQKYVGTYEIDTAGSFLIEPFSGRVSCLQIYAKALSMRMIRDVKTRCWT